MAPQVLLVASDTTMAGLLMEVVTIAGAGQVIHVPDCGRALAWLQAAGRADLLLLDLGYPPDDGVAFCTTLADRGPWATTPILVLADQPDRLPLAPRPGLTVLGKPFDLAAILAMIVAHFPAPPHPQA